VKEIIKEGLFVKQAGERRCSLKNKKSQKPSLDEKGRREEISRERWLSSNKRSAKNYHLRKIKRDSGLLRGTCLVAWLQGAQRRENQRVR